MRTQARKKSRELPGKDREEQAALLVAALGLDGVVLRRKGFVGARGSRNWPVVGFTLTEATEDAGASNLDEDEVEASSSDADDARRRLELTVAAEQGSADAQTELALMHTHGQGGPEDAAEAERLFQLAAAQGNAKAQFIVGEALCSRIADGKGDPEDAAEAKRLLQLAAEQGYIGAQFSLGLRHGLGTCGMAKDSQLARRCIEPLAAQGHTEAQVVFACLRLVDKEFKEARCLLDLAVVSQVTSNYYVKAQFLLACMKGTGLGGPEDTAEALRLLSDCVGRLEFRFDIKHPEADVEPPDADVEPSSEAEVDSLEQIVPSPTLDAVAWQCLGCNAINSGNKEVCTNRLGGKPCNSRRATGLALGSLKRSRGGRQRLHVSGGAGTSCEDAGGASSSSTGANPKAARGGGSKTPGRGMARVGSSAAAAPALAEAGLLEPVNKVTKALLAKNEALRELDRMVGIASVKTAISALCDVVIFNEMNCQVGKEPPAATHHMLFLGNPGTGKTTVARIVSKMLYQIGIVREDTIKEYDNARTALVDGNVNCTAGKAAKVIKQAVGGVLFLDEARHPSRIARRTLTRTRTHRPHAHRLTRSCPGPAATTTRNRPLMRSSWNQRSTVTTRS